FHGFAGCGSTERVRTRKLLCRRSIIMKILSVLLLFVVFLGSFDSVQAQNKATTPRIGVLSVTAPPNPNIDIFVKALQDHGYTDGKNIAIDYRYARGK